MNLANLATLAAIVDCGSFAAAAEMVGRTPSAVSLQVRQLETWFGRPLFDRSTRTVRPTSFGRDAAAVARDIAARLDALRTRPALNVAGRVRLGAIATMQSDVLPRALKRLRDRHPALDVELMLADSDALIASVKSGRLDAAVVVRPASGGSRRLDWRTLLSQPYVLLAPSALAGKTVQDILQRHEVIRYDPALTGGRIAARYLRDVFPRARVTLDVRSIDAIVAMVSAGLGVSIVPQPRQALLDAHGVHALALGRRRPARQIAFVARRADAENRNVAAMADALMD
ncbi:MAG TPA: LysR family transcriptional regulator [Vicinamibacterales bacterium]|nr:LysR family transcriptional regulator [Vicinamibacterales bacterium]